MARIIIITFDAATGLDAAGPAEVFAAATRRMGPKQGYALLFASTGGGMRDMHSGLSLRTVDLSGVRPQPGDTVLVTGGFAEATRPAMRDQVLLQWLRRAANRADRIASVCSGAFVLAAAGLLDQRRATTHWMGGDRLRELFPQVQVDASAIYVQDGKFWTSAGVTTGIDMSLAMVEQDCGREVADSVAAELVLYLRRPGLQSQFSEALVTQREGTGSLQGLMSWVRAHLRAADVETLAAAASLSVRTLHRRCRELAGLTPARMIDRVRLEHARTLLATTSVSLKRLADQCGFGSAANMRRIFVKELGLAPQDYRLLHGRAAS